MELAGDNGSFTVFLTKAKQWLNSVTGRWGEEEMESFRPLRFFEFLSSRWKWHVLIVCCLLKLWVNGMLFACLNQNFVGRPFHSLKLYGLHMDIFLLWCFFDIGVPLYFLFFDFSHFRFFAGHVDWGMDLRVPLCRDCTMQCSIQIRCPPPYTCWRSKAI